jgi:hypothetical protein
MICYSHTTFPAKLLKQFLQTSPPVPSVLALVTNPFSSPVSTCTTEQLRDSSEAGNVDECMAAVDSSWEDVKLSRGPARPGSNPGPAERHLSSFLQAAR